ncbi:MAG: NADPH-dependent glutamate synthase [Candidatus Omnitrophica bacterium]|nr:NADPH-dependent glutamate synthase [Candidatus Omnitrophota bacterium]
MAAKVPRQKMPEQAPGERIGNFDEVPLGFPVLAADREASRCLECKKPPCQEACPIHIDIPAFIRLIKEKKYAEGARKIKEANPLPAVCGRVCPQEGLCEKACVLAKKGEPVAIGSLERFVADEEGRHHDLFIPALPPLRREKIAVVGSGPSGLICAERLRLLGYGVTIFEALHKPGGVLMYGIPEFRLPKGIMQREIEYLKGLGIEIVLDAVVGRTVTIDELMGEAGFSAVYIAIGAGGPIFMGIPGENLNYVYSANELLTRVNLMKAYQFPRTDTPVKLGRRVAVIGGGNTALDAARSALRLGTDKVYLLYRRSRQEMPARLEEVSHAEEEGVDFQFLTAPVAFLGDENGNVKTARCIRMELGQPDASGRRRPVPIKGSEYTIELDSAVMGIGTRANPLLTSATPALTLNKWGYIVVDENHMTSLPGVFAGGDIVTGSATVIEAMATGKLAAASIDAYIQNK